MAITFESEPKKVLTKQEIHDKEINELLYGNGMDAVNIKPIELVKKTLAALTTWEILKSFIKERDSIIIITQKFITKNAFDGTLRKEVVVSINTLGNIKDIIK